MNIKILKTIDYLVGKSETKTGLFALQRIFKLGIPFNKPHGISFISLTNNSSCMKMENKRMNHNHLGGIHACAIATIGEFTAGILLSKNFQMSKYRVIMKTIHVDYHKQARTNILSKSEISTKEIHNLLKGISLNSKAEVDLKTEIYDANKLLVATVCTTWQLKDWDKTNL